MKRGSVVQKTRESPRDRARSALDLIDCSIEWDEVQGETEGDDTVSLGLDAMASALVEWRGLPLSDAAPLDEVLVEVGAEDELIDAAARLIGLVARAGYTSGLGAAVAKRAEGLRQHVHLALEALIEGMEEQEARDGNA